MNHIEVKEYYNKKISQDKNYENDRWAKNNIQKANFIMTRDTILHNIKNINYKTCLELGPGHGTWTELLLDKSKEAKYDLVDISREMLSLAKEKFKIQKNIQYFESDFLNFKFVRTYDFFFSSRAIEYIDDKEKTVKKIVDVLNRNGQGFIITKTPHYVRTKLMNRKVSKFHSGQILPSVLKKIMQKNGLVDIKIYPVTFSWPFWKSVIMNKVLYKIFSQKEICPISQFFSESYLIKFKKK